MSFDPTKIGPQYTFKETNTNFGVAGTKQVLLFNPYRVGLLVSASSLGQMSMNPSVAANTGIGIVNPGVTQFSLATSGPFVQQAFFFNGQAGCNFCTVEVLWVPPGFQET